jgi:hypothetical protein
MPHRAIEVVALACVVLGLCGFTRTQCRRRPRLPHLSRSYINPVGFRAAHSRIGFQRLYRSAVPTRTPVNHAAIAGQQCPAPAYDILAAEGRAVKPDLAIQYGCVIHPEIASGSFGAMLRGENPAPDLP